MVSTLAGGGSAVTAATSGEIIKGRADGVGTAATFNQPVGLALDGNGNLLVSDITNNNIRRVAIATGTVSTVAGGTPFGRVDGTGTTATFGLAGPGDLVCDGAGNAYVADNGNNMIRKIVLASGAVTAFAGFADTGRVDAVGTAARFSSPYGITYDGTANLFVADRNNHVIRQVVVASATVSTLVGGGASGYSDGTGTAALFNQPIGLMFSSGSLFVADNRNHVIRRVVIATGVVSTLAGTPSTSGYADGTGTSATFSFPRRVCSDGAGGLFISDTGNARIRRLVLSTGVVTSYAGNPAPFSAGTQFSDGPVSTAEFMVISGLQYTGGKLYVADSAARIRVVAFP